MSRDLPDHPPGGAPPAVRSGAALTGEGHENRTYELGGDTAWNFPEFTAESGRQAGREVAYTPASVETHTELPVDTGMPDLYASIPAGADASFAYGELAGTSGELSRLIGRRTTPIANTIAAVLNG